MTWSVQATSDAKGFLGGLSDDEFAKVSAVVRLLEEMGPSLGRPYADSVKGSRHSNMKELRIKLGTKEFRILFAFDPNRSAILLVGGDKVGDKRWYETFIAIADRLLDEHLANISKNTEKPRP